MYLIALLCPPLAIFLSGKPFQAVLSLFIFPFYFPCALWALLVVSARKADLRHREMLKATKAQTKEIKKQTKEMARQTKELSRAIRDQPINELAMQAIRANTPQQPSLPPNPPSIAPTLPPEPIAGYSTEVVPVTTRIREAAKMAWGSLKSAKSAGLLAYRELPEWAQPITWGLAAGTPVSIVFAAVMLARR